MSGIKVLTGLNNKFCGKDRHCDADWAAASCFVLCDTGNDEPSNGPLIDTHPGITPSCSPPANNWNHGTVSRWIVTTLIQPDQRRRDDDTRPVKRTPWRRSLKTPPGLGGRKKTVNFMSWPSCCRCPPPSRPSWTKRPSSAWPLATWRWGSSSLKVRSVNTSEWENIKEQTNIC